MNRTRREWLLRATLAVTMLAFGIAVFAYSSAFSVAANDNESSALAQTDRVISFSSGSYQVDEDDGFAIITVRIEPMPVTTATIEYLTLDGTAKAASDYTSVGGVLTFANPNDPGDPNCNETECTFRVPIIDNSVHESTESVNLVLRNPVNASLNPTLSTAILSIIDNDPTPTNTPKSATATPVYVDLYEPNNSFQSAYTTAANAGALCNITLWPRGDVDYFRFVGKRGSAYEVLTKNLDSGLDTVITVYDSSGNALASNDDYSFSSRASRAVISAGADGYYYVRVSNKSPSDPANQTYCFDANEIQGTATPRSSTRVPGADSCEYNGDFDTACLIGEGNTPLMNFVPIWGEGPDNDYFRLWIKPGILYTCETFDLSSVNDTNMILYDQNRNGLAGNDDKALGEFGSKVSYLSTYTGWLYVLVGPHAIPDYGESWLYTYSLKCNGSPSTPTPLPTATRPPAFVGTTVPRPPTATPFVEVTPSPSPTFQILVATLEPTATPNVQFIPLPTTTPVVAPVQTIRLDLTIYYDANQNFNAELTEGVEKVAVAIYDNMTNEFLAFGYTNEAGEISFGSLMISGAVRVSIPFLQYTHIATADSNITIRVAPWALPGGSS